jgi:hypothetical protein
MFRLDSHLDRKGAQAMFTFTLNGKPFDPDDFQDAMMEAVVNQVKEHLHQQISSIRNPITGEFPVVQVSGTIPEDISARVEASPELLQLIRERITPDDLNRIALIETKRSSAPKAFLSYGWEDRDLAKDIAEALQASGIETWWAEWEIRAGDSLRQKIDEGLTNCTDFLVLLTPESIKKPWVNQEMDAGLIRKIESQARFIPIRKNLPASALPPLLRGMMSPALEDFDADIRQLIADIHGVLRKPALGPAPPVSTHEIDSGYSLAATAIAKLFVEMTENALHSDPMLSINQVCDATLLSEEDVSDALHELRGMVEENYGTVMPAPELFVTFDKLFRDWDPAADALRIAADLLNEASFPREPQQIAERYAWNPRRLNPALAYLIGRKLIQSLSHLGMGPWIAAHLEKTDATRRFVKSRQ